ncbi:peptidase S8 and S53 subtilisin kexin sedolisin [Chloroherpeton thalassium ATCC 35110]|uniref:Peptidase S8 and S53 subtilisin kexin sedolisin n=1 Tax=Chloroherpeton thalassium (strain ATCC 35110 / GB-78) TaxID=517418 RepID=B3QTG1_CHLT3|nr:S8 family serine peptidase [Chloroherpeton thalassium]ACF12707.1 peptidase S8 and S53 subtilisin kexin sedolisin [Chloroherpeton thalassium ATCC 35110]
MFKFKVFSLLLIFSIFGSSFSGAIALASQPDSTSNKFSAKIGAPLRVLLREAKTAKAKSPQSLETFSEEHRQFAVRKSASGQTMVGLLLKSENVMLAKSAIINAGGTVSTIAGNILVARVPLDSVESIVAGESISRVEACQKQALLLDSSRAEIYADVVQAGEGGLDQSYNGTDVIVGVVDSGIDEDHADFNTTSGSRILYLWDMSGSGNSPSSYDYGTEYTQSQITAGQCNQSDDDGHGTHVTGIAAGNGRAESGFTGIAPDADIIFVKGYRDVDGFYSDDVINGCAYIFERADKVNKSAVVNLSLGGHVGPHDGTSLYEQALSNLVDEGKIIVAAAGNSGSSLVHVNYETGGSSFSEARETYFEISSSTSAAYIDLWYETGSVNVGIAAYRNGSRVDYTSSVAPGGQLSNESLGSGFQTFGTVTIDATETSYSENGDKRVLIEITNNNVTGVTWSLFTYGSGTLDAWLSGGSFTEDSGRLIYPGDNEKSVAIPSTAEKVICVGSYTTKNKWKAYDGNTYSLTSQPEIGAISSFSSLGPSRDGRTKPDIAAPGQVIMSALSSDLTIGSDVTVPYVSPSGELQAMQGTSMASPHVAGTIALMLEKNPQADYETVMDILTTTARQDDETGSVPNNTWGYGKLDVLEAMLQIAEGEKDTTTSGDSEDDTTATQVTVLKSGYPNPVFSSRGYITILYEIPENTSVQAPYYLKIYDVLGREVASHRISADETTVSPSIKAFASGMYFYRITGFSDMKKFVILKNE